MTTPSSGSISLRDIENEISDSTVASTASLNAIYATSNALGYTGALQYHNLAMGTGGNLTAKMIYEIDNLGTNLGVTGWYNYSQDVTVKTNYFIERVGAPVGTDLTGNLYLADSGGNALGTIASFTLTAGGPTAGGVAATTISNTTTQNVYAAGSGYFLYLDASVIYNPPPPPFPPPPPLPVQVDSSGVDVDGVGSGTSRSGLPTPVNFSDSSPLSPPIEVLGGTSAGDPIANNKRSGITITFTG